MNNILYIVLPIWIILTLFFLYKYIVSTSEVKATKGGTFVEGIFENVSYLPYRGDSSKDSFYQSLLFPKCSDYKLSGDYILYTGSSCDVQTKDYKKFYIKVNSGQSRSDGKPLSIDDVFFTYHKILKTNNRDLSWGDKYTNVDVMQIDSHTISVVFPSATVDNMIFFTNNLLPNHILKDATIEQYTNEFSHNPVTRGNAHISPVQDKSSFVYDLTNCNQTFMSYYQLKKFDTLSDLESRKEKGLTIDTYKNTKKLPDYIEHTILDSDYILLFFNSQSKKISKRIKRALGGLIVNKLYTGTIDNILHDTHLYLDTFLSNGKGIENYLKNYNPNLDFDRKDIENLKISQLPNKITVEKEKKKVVYYLDSLTGTKKIDIGVYSGEQYKKVTIQTPNSTGEQQIKLKKRHHDLFINQKDIKEGANKYRVRGWRMIYDEKSKKKILKKRNIVDIDIYYIPSTQYTGNTLPFENKINIIYFKGPHTKKIVRELSLIFTDQKINKYFVFIGYDNIEDFEQKIISKEYDIVLRTLSLGLQKDLSNLFLTDNAIVNPSLYVQTSLASNINNYLLYKNSNFTKSMRYKKDIDKVYGNDIPFIILGQIKDKIYTHKDIITYPFGSQDLYTFHNYIYRNTQIKRHYKPSWKNFMKKSNFYNYINNIVN